MPRTAMRFGATTTIARRSAHRVGGPSAELAARRTCTAGADARRPNVDTAALAFAIPDWTDVGAPEQPGAQARAAGRDHMRRGVG